MTSALRILMVSDLSPLHIAGGGERVLWEQASRLRKIGHQVRILSRAPADGVADTVEREGVRIRHFPVDRRSLLRFVRGSILEARRAAGRELAEADADVLNLYQPYSGYGVLRSPAGRRIPSLYTFLSPAPLEYRSRRGMSPLHRAGGPGALGLALLWFLEGACLRRATRIHVLSKFSARLLWELYRIPADRIVKIPGGVDTERFQPAADRNAVRDALGLPTRPLLFTVRNLEARMGLDILIRAMAILRRHVPEILLLIGGTGSRRHDLESLTGSLGLNDHVRFLGYVPEAQLPLYLQASDLFVLPTRELEGFGLVTVEALACGTPVLGTPVGATPEILYPLDPALLFRDMSPEGMAEDLRRVLDRLRRDPHESQSLQQAWRRHATAHYSWDDAVAYLEGALRQLADRREDWPDSVRACPACGDLIQAGDLYYRGARYLRCSRCGTGAVAGFPSVVGLQRYYESEYPLRYHHEWVTEPRAEMFASILDRLAELQKPGRLLDVGCGGGHLLRVADQRGWHGLGSDLSHRACTIARRAWAGGVVQAEGGQTPVRDASVDAVTFVNVLDHVPDPLGALREARRVLSPGGHLAIRIPNAAFHRPWVRLLTTLGPLVRRYGWDGYPILHLYAFTARSLRRVVERAGFQVLEVRNSALAAQAPWVSQGGPRKRLQGWLRTPIAAVAGSVAVLSRRRWLVGPSIELYATRPPADDEADGRP